MPLPANSDAMRPERSAERIARKLAGPIEVSPSERAGVPAAIDLLELAQDRAHDPRVAADRRCWMQALDQIEMLPTSHIRRKPVFPDVARYAQ